MTQRYLWVDKTTLVWFRNSYTHWQAYLDPPEKPSVVREQWQMLMLNARGRRHWIWVQT